MHPSFINVISVVSSVQRRCARAHRSTRTVTDSVISYVRAREMRSPRIIYENCPVLLLSVTPMQGRCAAAHH